MYVSDFHVSQSQSCSAHMMYQEARFRYRHIPEDHVQLLEMPYRGDDITMVIILPSKGSALRQVRSSSRHLTPTLLGSGVRGQKTHPEPASGSEPAGRTEGTGGSGSGGNWSGVGRLTLTGSAELSSSSPKVQMLLSLFDGGL